MRRRRIVLRGALLLLLCGAAELLAWGCLYALDRLRGVHYEPVHADALSRPQQETLERLLASQSAYLAHSPALGWTLRPNGASEAEPGYRANAQGLRADRELTAQPAPGTLRISTFGDSFTHGSDVRFEETWQEQMRALDPGLELPNFAVPGYGLDQSYLRFRQDAAGLRTHLVFIGFLSENLFRTVNTFRPFYMPHTQMPLSKPRYLLGPDGLQLVENRLRTVEDCRRLLAGDRAFFAVLGQHDHYYRSNYRAGDWDALAAVRLAKLVGARLQGTQGRAALLGPDADGTRVYRTDSEAFQVTFQLFVRFYREVLQDQAVPVVVLFPEEEDLGGQRHGRPPKYRPLVQHLERHGLRWLDVLEAFEGEAAVVRLSDLYGTGHHFTPLANRLAANFLYTRLQAMGLLDDRRRAQLLQEETAKHLTGASETRDREPTLPANP